MKRSIPIILALILILVSFQSVLAGAIQFAQPVLTNTGDERKPFQYQLSEHNRTQNFAVLSRSENHSLSQTAARPRQMNRQFRLLLAIVQFLLVLYTCCPADACRLISQKLIDVIHRRTIRCIQVTYGL